VRGRGSESVVHTVCVVPEVVDEGEVGIVVFNVFAKSREPLVERGLILGVLDTRFVS